MRLFYYPEGKLRLEMDGKCWLDVRPVWAAPLSQPKRYLGLLDGKDKEITMVTDPSTLPADQFEILENELNRRYLTAQVERIVKCSTEFGATYWTVDTDRGRKEFVTQSLQENALWMGRYQLLLIDVDGNRFEISDLRTLDPASQKMLAATV